ncbi:hypothetical protein lerEdw1_008278 [Lerista edwardsae]|nr:hypothetical protein lerEdw1_008278 [Lerista edwardsae]
MIVPCGRFSGEERRRVKANNREYNSRFHYANNRIRTSKYSILTFLPINLFEQFKRAANAYFLFLLILQLIPEISSLSWFTTIVPLVLVLTVTAVKDATDDYFRHQNDDQVNNRQAKVLLDGELQNEKWMNVRAGDVIKLENNQFVVADLLLLSSSEPHGLCYIETAELDGETNLKVRQPLAVTSELGDDISRLVEFDGAADCEAPNDKLDKFEGILSWNDCQHYLNIDRILLRGCVLRNTEWCFGMVIFAGPDTKLMQNSGKPQLKRTSIDRLMNTLILWLFGLLFFMGIILGIGNSAWEHQVGIYFEIYQHWDEPVTGSIYSGFLTFWSYIIILNSVVPISLYLSVEVIRLGHSCFVNWDRKMYYDKEDCPAEVRTTTLSEELGQIEYIFSDKTGTLTQNIMTFNKCSINGIVYGEVIYQAQSPDEGALVSAAKNFGFIFKTRTPNTITVEEMGTLVTYRLLAILDFNNDRKRMSVIVQNPDGQIKLYSKGADTILFERLHPSSQELMTLTTDHLAQFAGDGLRTLVVAYKNLDKEYFQEWFELYQKANAANADCRDEKIALAYEEIERDLQLLGATAIEDKLQDGVTETIANLLRANIKIWILTGDKQETAMNIGYSCRILTDFMDEIFIVAGQTEMEVGKELRKAKDHIFGCSSDSSSGSTSRENHDVSMEDREGTVTGDYALVINGHSLAHALKADLEYEFVETACICTTVICCRVTPLQKAQVVELIKKHKRAITLAIGDGANDISMIRSAHIGVGISGREGTQAVWNSDYSFAQFKYLQRLLLVHGRWSYFRMCKFLCYFFYKNVAFTLIHFWFAFFSGFSAQQKFTRRRECNECLVDDNADDDENFHSLDVLPLQTIYDQWFITLFNIVYTSMPVLAMGLLDQDVNEQDCLDFPKLYAPGQQNLLFNKRIFFICIAHGIYTSFVLFFIPCGSFYGLVEQDGKNIGDYHSFAVTISTSLIIVVNVQIALDTSYWTCINYFFIWGSIAVYFASLFVMHSNSLFKLSPNYYPFVGNADNTLDQTNIWLIILLTTVISIIPVITFRFMSKDVSPTLSDQIRFLHKAKRKKRPIPKPMHPRYISRPRRSAYAFSHVEGYGELITSGKNMRFSGLRSVSGTGKAMEKIRWIDNLRKRT